MRGSPDKISYGSPSQDDEKSNIQLLAEKIVKLPTHDQNEIDLDDYRADNITYIHNIGKLFVTLSNLFKEQNVGEAYEFSGRNFFELPKDVRGQHHLRTV